MTASDKARFNEIMKTLRNKDISDEEREQYLKELATLTEKYGS